MAPGISDLNWPGAMTRSAAQPQLRTNFAASTQYLSAKTDIECTLFSEVRQRGSTAGSIAGPDLHPNRAIGCAKSFAIFPLTELGCLKRPTARKLRAQIGIAGDLTYAPDHIRYIKRVDQHCGVASDFAKRAGIGCQDWHAKLHCFHYRQPKSFANRRICQKTRTL
jgi:hypothetical protein